MASILNMESGWRALVRIRGFNKARTFKTEAEARAWAFGVEEAVVSLVIPQNRKVSPATHSLHIAEQIARKNEILDSIKIAPRKDLEREFRRWRLIHSRCYREDAPNYHLYGGRGIKVCDRWNIFELFFSDMGLPPAPGMSIDRVNNDGDYTPENCRWATHAEQCANKRYRSGEKRVATSYRIKSKKAEGAEWNRLLRSSQFIRDLDALLAEAGQ